MTDAMEIVRAAVRSDGEPVLMMPAQAYTSTEVLDWERRHLFAGGWLCLGRVDDLFPEAERRPIKQRAVMVGDVSCLLVRDKDAVRMFANTCRHRGHELLPDGSSSNARRIACPYHAWNYDLGGSLVAAPGFSDGESLDFSEHSLAELPVRVWHGWAFGHALHPLGSPQAPPFDKYVGELARIVAPYSIGNLVVADRHSYEVAANWKTIAENYHECYHCPMIHPELCQVSSPDSGDNYQLPGVWIGGSMDLRDGMETMSMTGELASTLLPSAPAKRVEYVHLLPNLLISAHPDFVMAHRLVPLAPDRTWVECSWFVTPPTDGAAPSAAGAVEFWDLTNKQDWAACESVQRGLSSPHFQPGPFAPREDAVAQLVSMIGRGYREGRFSS